jgi:hypothetical protein
MLGAHEQAHTCALVGVLPMESTSSEQSPDSLSSRPQHTGALTGYHHGM